MKQLLLIRHAKSSWAQYGQLDFDRPLNDRGHKDAVAMALRLKEKLLQPDLVVSSAANRALTTAQHFTEILGITTKEILVLTDLYHAPPAIIFSVIASLPPYKQRVAIVCHNPGITECVNQFGVVAVNDMPTAGIFGVQSTATTWATFMQGNLGLLYYDFPKND